MMVCHRGNLTWWTGVCTSELRCSKVGGAKDVRTYIGADNDN